MVRNAILAPVSLVLMAGAIVMMIFVILSGVRDVKPLNETYFLRADTHDITGARSVTQWTYLYMCGPGNERCSGAWPDPPVGWAWAADARGAPPGLVGDKGGHTTSSYYFYMWRFGWVFYLIGFFFAVVGFFAGFLACLGRLGAALAGLTGITALFFTSLAASLMTATFVKMRDAFHAVGRDASLGRYAFGFTWAAWTCILLATALFFLGVASGRDRAARDTTGAGAGTGARRWGRRRNVSNSVGSHRVKEDYA